jgi:hypothetical protein
LQRVFIVERCHGVFLEKGIDMIFFQIVLNDTYVIVDTQNDEMTTLVSLFEFDQSLNRRAKEFSDIGRLVGEFRTQKVLTSKVNRIIQILNLGFVYIVVDSTNRLKVAGFLNIDHIILDAEFSAD